MGRPDGFHFEIHFTRGFGEQFRPEVLAAAERWAALVTGPKPPSHTVGGRTARDPVMVVSSRWMKSKRYAETKYSQAWSVEAGPLVGRPSRVEITFNSRNLNSHSGETLQQITAHEIGHGLGMALTWGRLLRSHSGRWFFTGECAMLEYGILLGRDEPTEVPVDYDGIDTHWREREFARELMSPDLGKGILPISSVTLASLVDLGYEVNVKAADAFALANKARARAGAGCEYEKRRRGG